MRTEDRGEIALWMYENNILYEKNKSVKKKREGKTMEKVKKSVVAGIPEGRMNRQSREDF